MNKNHLLYFLFIAVLASSCSNTRYLPEGELLYTGATLKLEGKEVSNKEKKVLKNELKELSDMLNETKTLFSLRPNMSSNLFEVVKNISNKIDNSLLEIRCEFDENIDSVAIFQNTDKVSSISKLSKIDSTRINLNENKYWGNPAGN